MFDTMCICCGVDGNILLFQQNDELTALQICFKSRVQLSFTPQGGAKWLQVACSRNAQET